jgi:hypothetical protein
MLCACPRDRLCGSCLENGFAQLRGVAACRGERWARTVRERCGSNATWPRTARAHAIALRKVEDLAADRRLRERLADELERWAARRWTENSEGRSPCDPPLGHHRST